MKQWYYVILVVAAFAVYANSLSNDFVFDDESVVLGDPSIAKISNIPKYFTGEEGFHKVIGRYYRPLVSASYALDYVFYGLKPFGFHLTNVIIHIINCLLFLKFLNLIFRRRSHEFTKANSEFVFLIFLSAVIFAVHPIHTEAVSWVSGRTDSLSFTFFIAAFIFYIRYKEIRTNSYFFLTILAYLLSLLAKEMAITFPVLIFLYDITVNHDGHRGGSRNISNYKKNIPIYSALILISILYMLLRWFILKDVPQRETYFYFYGKDFITVVATMLQTLPLYFRLLFFPVGLLYHYSGYLPYQNSFLNYNVIVSVLFVIVMVVLAVLLYKKFSLISYSILFFFISLVPVLNIIPTMNFMAERFLYIPSIIVSIVLAEIVLKLDLRGALAIKQSFVSKGLLTIIIVFYSYLTISRNADWKNNDTLFLSAEGKPGTVTYVNIGNIYANKNQTDIAETYYRKAISLRPETLLAQNNLGKVFLVKGIYDSAVFYMTKAHLLDTLSPEPMLSLAQAYSRMGNLPEAVKYLERIQKITPGYMSSDKMLEELKTQSQGWNPVAQLENQSYQDYQNKNYEKAVQDLLDLVQLNPQGAAGYYNNIGICYLEQNKLQDAEKYFKLSIEKKNDFPTPYGNLGKVYEIMGDKEKAKENYLKAVALDPNNTEAKKNLERMK